MQRVLSFPPPSRGFGDPSEFVSKRMCFSFMFSLGFLAFLGGFLLGRFVFDQELELSRSKLKKAHLHHQQVFGLYKNYSQFNTSSILEEISESALQEHLSLLSNYSNAESLHRNLREAEVLQRHFKANGFDLVSPLVESHMHLSYPSSQFPSEAFILDEENQVVLQINDTRQTYNDAIPEESAATSTVEGNIVYVNFGRNEDYHYLDSIGVSVSGSIVLMRAGGIVPMEMVNNALDHEAKGILLYVDPQQKDIKLPLLTPGDLAKLQILHRNQIDKWIGNVPLLEISSSDAEKIFLQMSAREYSTESWRGKLKCSYPIGPGFTNTKWKFKMEVNTVNIAKTYFNVLGAIRGSQEPDRFVMLAHEKTVRNNESQSASVMMEIIRVLGNLKRKGWKPHRSIVIAFWGVEGPNQHLTSYPESLWSQLITKTVTYLKIDNTYQMESEHTRGVGTPILEKLFYKSTKTASMKNPSIDQMLPLVADNLLIQYGIPFLMMESFNINSNETLKELASFWGVTTWNLAESHGLPFSLESYVRFFSHSVDVIEKRFKVIAQKHMLFLDTFFKSIQDLINTIRAFEDKWSHADKSKSIEMRIMNDQLLSFTRSLICEQEQTASSNILSSGHLIFSKSLTASDEKAGFGVLQDFLREISSTRAPGDLNHQIITQLTSLVECINLARYSLSDGLEAFVTIKI